MKNTLKRLGALLIAAIMMIAMCVPVMAATNTPSTDQVTTALDPEAIPSSDDTATVFIRGFEDQNVTITAYQIVQANYYEDADPQSGFAGYEICFDDHKNLDPFTVVSGEQTADGNPIYVASYPTSAQINLLAGHTGDLSTSQSITNFTQEGDTYTASADLPVGAWMIIAEDTDGNYVYNPMVVSAYYIDNGTKIAINKIDIDGSWDWADHDVALATTNAYVKSTKPNPSKKITDDDIDTKDSAEHGNDTAIGKTVSFEIDATIPSYSEEYYSYTTTVGGKQVLEEKTCENAVIFWVSDTLDKGLTLDRDSITVEVNDEVLDPSNYELTYTPASATPGTAQTFKIALTKNYLKTLAGKPATERDIVVTYEATVNEYATTNFEPNKNTMKVTYNNKPDTGSGNTENPNKTEEEDITYHYTFEIDGKIAGTGQGVRYDKTTHELIKIDETGEPIDEDTFVEETSEEYPVPQAVKGAVFKLTGTSGDGSGAVFYAITDENGYFVAAPAGDATKEYTLADGTTTITGADIKGFKQMDVGTYELKEVKAPEGFSLDSSAHTVEITAEYYNEDQYTGEGAERELTAHKGELKSYTIEIDGTQTSTYEATYDAGVVEEVENLTEGNVETTYIKNTRIPALPSTGGMGAYLFTIIGVAVMAVVAGSYFRSRAKKV